MTDIQIVHADALTIPPASLAGFDVMITDPPYSAHVHENAASAGTLGEGSRGWHRRDLGFAHLSPELRAHVARLAESVRRWSVIFSDHEGTFLWRGFVSNNGLGPTEYIRLVPWVRWSQPQKSGDRPGSQSEAVLHFHAPGAKHWNGPGSLTHYARKCMRGAEKHPTEKPLDLLLDMVSWFSDPGENVIDPCAGAGTTALACKLLGRGCAAIEAQEAWAAHATARLATFSDRDRTKAAEWCESTTEEAGASLAKPPAADGSDVKTRARAQRRLDDVERVRAWL